jgi:hypothetical protein
MNATAMVNYLHDDAGKQDARIKHHVAQAGGQEANIGQNETAGFVRMETGDLQKCHGIGAGEGNRTLVFSLEGCRVSSCFKAHSDKTP